MRFGGRAGQAHGQGGHAVPRVGPAPVRGQDAPYGARTPARARPVRPGRAWAARFSGDGRYSVQAGRNFFAPPELLPPPQSVPNGQPAGRRILPTRVGSALAKQNAVLPPQDLAAQAVPGIRTRSKGRGQAIIMRQPDGAAPVRVAGPAPEGRATGSPKRRGAYLRGAGSIRAAAIFGFLTCGSSVNLKAIFYIF